MDILLGLGLLASQVLLCYSSIKRRRETLTLFFILSMAVLVLYWVWFAYLKYGKEESEASKEVGNFVLEICVSDVIKFSRYRTRVGS